MMIANNVLGWLIVGALAGWLASAVMHTRLQHGLLIDVLLGLLGAAFGGVIFTALRSPVSPGFSTFSTVGLLPALPGFSAWSILIAFLAALVLLGVQRLLLNMRATRHLRSIASLSDGQLRRKG